MLTTDTQIHAHVVNGDRVVVDFTRIMRVCTVLIGTIYSQVTLTSPSSPQEHSALPSGLHCTHTTAPTWADT